MGAPVIGIDLGTTNSCAAVANDAGEIRLVPYRGGQFTVPSVFAIDEQGRELIGHEAQRQAQLNPKRTIYGSKRLIGVSSEAALVQEMRKRVTFPVEPGDANDVVFPIGKLRLKPMQVAAKILAKVKEVATTHLGVPIERAVITVPAYYNDRQRQEVREAGKLAGLEVVRIINEPTAAAIAYGARKTGHEKLAVYDLGGGTFDISVIEMRDRIFEVKATGGNTFLGGLDFDSALIQYIMSEFKTKHGIDLAGDPIAMQRLRDMAERVKVDLSARAESPMAIPFISIGTDGKPIDLNVIIKRDELESLVEHLVEQTFETCARVCDEAGLSPGDLDQVLLVGGQTRMPLIQQRIAKFFGKQPSKAVHPDEAVAIGAALFAWSLDERSNLKFQLLDVIPMAIGIETAQGQLHHLFERNSPVPNQKQFTFTTHRDNQADLVMRLYQGDNALARDNTLLGEFTFAGLRPGKSGSVRVEVVFEVSAEGILSLAAKDLDTGTNMKQTVTLKG